MEAGRLLEMGVLADIRREESDKILEKALGKLKESRKHMDRLHAKIDDLRTIEKKNKPLPEHVTALANILKNHPPIERVSLTNSRFANVSQAQGISVHFGPVGSNFDELLESMQTDLAILKKEHDQAIEAFEAVLPTAKDGGFAAIVLSGRAPLPERIMHSADQMMVFVHSVDRRCMTTIAADMQVYPKGLEWLPKAGWRKGEKSKEKEEKQDEKEGLASLETTSSNGVPPSSIVVALQRAFWMSSLVTVLCGFVIVVARIVLAWSRIRQLNKPPLSSMEGS